MLFELIHSLSPSEKRYFKLFAEKHVLGTKNKYFTLFEHLAQEDSYDELKLPSSLTHNLASDKHFLFQLILKAMRAYRSQKGVDKRLSELISDLEFLFEKRLYKPCRKLLKKAKEMATLHDRMLQGLLLLEFERRYNNQVFSRDQPERLKKLQEEREELMHKLDLQNQYAHLFDELFSTVRTQFRLSASKGNEMLDALMLNPLLKDEQNVKTFQSKSHYLLCQAFANQLKGELQASFLFNQRNIEHWQAHPVWIKEEPRHYLRAISNFLSACLLIDDYLPFPEILKNIKDMKGKSLAEKAEQFETYYLYAFVYHLNTFQFTEALAIIPDIELGLKKYKGQIPVSRQMTLCYNTLILYFYLEDHPLSLHWANHLLTEFPTDQRQDLQRTTRLLTLLLHFDLGNMDFLNYALRSTKRYFKQMDPTSFESYLLSFLSKLISLTPASQQAQFPIAIEELEKMVQAQNRSNWGTSEVLTWLKAKHLRRTLIDIARLSQ